MSVIRDAVGNMILRIEGITCDTAIGRGQSFRHAPECPSINELASLADPTRRFICEPNGDLVRGGHIQQRSRPQPTTTSWTVTIAYSLGSRPHEITLAMVEDIQTLADTLADPVLYADTDGGASRVIQRRITNAAITDGPVALVSLTVEFQYQPVYVGGPA